MNVTLKDNPVFDFPPSMKLFLIRAVKAAVNGVSNAITASFVDPHHFSPFNGGLKQFCTLMLAGAIVREAMFLKVWSENGFHDQATPPSDQTTPPPGKPGA